MGQRDCAVVVEGAAYNEAGITSCNNQKAKAPLYIVVKMRETLGVWSGRTAPARNRNL